MADTSGLTRRLLLQWAAAGMPVVTAAGTFGGSGARGGAGPARRVRATDGNQVPTAVKTRSTFYTPEKVAAARANVTELAWAAQLRDRAVAKAADPLQAGLEWLWESVTTQGLPRSIAVNQSLGSPITGTDIFEYGNYPWLADPYGRPWKLEDPSSGYVFPTNDFVAFYASALDEHGNFDADLGDPQYLVNTEYPDRGPDWGVDDGWGWIDDNGDKWTFAAYYNHWFSWYLPLPVGDHEMTSLRDGLIALRDAYLYTGEVSYAQHGIVLLDRFAQVYPEMDIAPYRREEGYLHSDGGRGQGKAIGSIWECGLAGELVLCYDAFFPALENEDEADVLEFLSAKAEQYDLDPKDTVADVRANIEVNLLREIYPAVLGAQIFGNFGMHQSTLARAAVVLDEAEAAEEWLDFVFASGGLVEGDDGWECTGGDVGRTLVENVDRDGWYFEGAPQYNILAIGTMQNLATTLDGFETYPAADVAEHPKFTAMVSARPRLTMLSTYTPSIGDSGQTGAPNLLGDPDDYVRAFERYGNVVDAQMAHLVNGNSSEGLRGDIFNPQAAGIEDRIDAVIDEHGPLALGSENLTGFGLAIHRTGEAAHERVMTTYYGTQQMHGHRNGLALGLFGHGLDLMPGLGYPEFADQNARRFEWESNTVASNTVVVDATPHSRILLGEPLGYLTSDQVQMSDIQAPEVYSAVSDYRRTTAMVTVDDERSYLVDLFRVRGGSEHVFSFHTAEGAASVDGVRLTDQDGGSYAGADIDPPDPSDPPRTDASGFDWLTRVQRGSPDGDFSIDWQIEDTYDVLEGSPEVHLRMTVLGDVEEVALADGIPPRNKPGNPQSLRYALLRRTGEDLDSTFTSVIEPYVDESAVASAETLEVTGDGSDRVAAVQVSLTDGRTDWIIHDPAGAGEVLIGGRIRMQGTFAVVRFDSDDQAISAHGHDLQTLRDGNELLLRGRQVLGTVTERTEDLAESSTMAIELDRPGGTSDLVGRYVYVQDDGERSAVYRIAAARSRGLRLELDVDTTFVRSYLDPEDLDAGYIYDVEPGRAIRIPPDPVWSR